MREIKFRAWDGSQMLQNVGTHPHIIQRVKDYTEGEEGAYIISNYFDSYTIMQFTGLKDKNGKEIYEGDIVTGYTSYENSNDEYEWTKENPAKVFWDNECAGFYPFIMNKRWRCDVEEIEVVGNIHENPEFIKE